VLHTARGRRSEAGFTIIEILVVMIIMGALAAIVISSFRGTRSAVNSRTVIAVATTYATGIRAFQLDHGNRVPNPAVARDWPRGAAAGNPLHDRGPLDELGRHYLRNGAPEPMQSGTSVLIDSASAIPAGGGLLDSYIRYERVSETAYTLEIVIWDGDSWNSVCKVGDAVGGPTC